MIKHVDEHGSLLHYSNRIVKVEYEGPISLVGPKEQTLLGGQLSLYFNSKNEKGKAKIRLNIDDLVKEVEVEVK